jgi:hypothetical protein
MNCLEEVFLETGLPMLEFSELEGRSPQSPSKGPRPLSSDVLAIDRSIPRRHYPINLIDGSGAWVSYERVRLCFRSVRLQRLSL